MCWQVHRYIIRYINRGLDLSFPMVFNTFLELPQKDHGRDYVLGKNHATYCFSGSPGGAGEGAGCPAGLVQVILLYRVANESTKRSFEGWSTLPAGNSNGVCTHLGASSAYCPPRRKFSYSEMLDKSIPWYPEPAWHLSGAALEGAGAGTAPGSAGSGPGCQPTSSFFFF